MSVPSYESYQDSGILGIGPIPTHWRLNVLKRAVMPQRQITYGIVQGGPDVAEGVPYIRPTDMTEESGVLNPASLLKTSSEIAEVYRRSSLLAGDLVCSIGPSFGKVMIVPPSLAGANLTQGTARVAVSGEYATKYIFWVLRSEPSRYQWECSIGGATFRALNLEPLSETKFCMPPLAEQLAIAAFLDRETAKIDALVEDQRRLIDLLKEKRQAVISHAVTKGLDPSVPMKDSGVEWLGEVPAHWAVRPLKYIASFQSGGTPSKERTDFWGGEIPWASAKDLKSESISDTIDHLSSRAIECGAATLMPKGVVLVLVRGMMLARTFPVCETTVPMAINQDLKAITGRQGVENSYLAWLFRGSSQETLYRLDEAGHGTKALRMEAWLSLPLPVPPQPEQAQIAEFVAKAVAQLDTLAEQAATAIALLQERRSALISAAVTGKIDVRGLASSEAEAA